MAPVGLERIGQIPSHGVMGQHKELWECILCLAMAVTETGFWDL